MLKLYFSQIISKYINKPKNENLNNSDNHNGLSCHFIMPNDELKEKDEYEGKNTKIRQDVRERIS